MITPPAVKDKAERSDEPLGVALADDTSPDKWCRIPESNPDEVALNGGRLQQGDEDHDHEHENQEHRPHRCPVYRQGSSGLGIARS